MTSHTSTSPSAPPAAPLTSDLPPDPHRQNVVLAFCLDNQPHLNTLAQALNLSLSTLLGILAEPQSQIYFDQLTQAVAKRDALITHRLRQAAQLVIFDKLTGNTTNPNLDSLVPLATAVLRSTKPIIHKAATPRITPPDQSPIPPDPFPPLPRKSTAPASTTTHPTRPAPEAANALPASAHAAPAAIAPTPNTPPTTPPSTTPAAAPISVPALSTPVAPTPQSAAITPPLFRSSPAAILAIAAGQLPRPTAKEPPHPRPESAYAA